jgi:hypothetical protein
LGDGAMDILPVFQSGGGVSDCVRDVTSDPVAGTLDLDCPQVGEPSATPDPLPEPNTDAASPHTVAWLPPSLFADMSSAVATSFMIRLKLKPRVGGTEGEPLAGSERSRIGLALATTDAAAATDPSPPSTLFPFAVPSGDGITYPSALEYVWDFVGMEPSGAAVLAADPATNITTGRSIVSAVRGTGGTISRSSLTRATGRTQLPDASTTFYSPPTDVIVDFSVYLSPSFTQWEVKIGRERQLAWNALSTSLGALSLNTSADRSWAMGIIADAVNVEVLGFYSVVSSKTTSLYLSTYSCSTSCGSHVVGSLQWCKCCEADCPASQVLDCISQNAYCDYNDPAGRCLAPSPTAPDRYQYRCEDVPADLLSPPLNPTPRPTLQPTGSPSPLPTAAPTSPPTASPTSQPSASPTTLPTPLPTTPPPTASPTNPPSPSPPTPPTPPTPVPTVEPTAEPTSPPTASPTALPTPLPTPPPLPHPLHPPPPPLSLSLLLPLSSSVQQMQMVMRYQIVRMTH